jgi:hypothetical protein
VHFHVYWSSPFQIAWDLFALALTLMAVIFIMNAPTSRFRRGWTSKVGWIAVAVLLSGSVGEYWIPLGTAVVLAIRPWRPRQAQIHHREDPLRERTDILPRRYLDGPSGT